MPTVLIIEDELPNIQRLEKMLGLLDRSMTIAARLQTIGDSIKWLQANEQPDIIFMDIRLTDGLSFEIFNHVEIKVPVIFITAYDEYALRAFEVNGVDYLLKPLDAEKLEKSVQRAKMLMPHGVDTSILQLVQRMQTKDPVYRSRFLINYRDKYILVQAGEIAYFKSEHKTTYLVMNNSQRYVIDQPLEVLEKEMDPQVFFRVSRQLIISLKSIHKIYQSFNGQLKIELTPALDEGIMISRDRSNQLKKWLDESDL